MNLGGSRQGDAALVVATHRFVRGWVWLYTLGLPLATRSARRTEIDSDVWDQTHAWDLHGPSTPGGPSSVVLRSLRGVPADLLWRFAEARTNRSSTEGRQAMQTLTMRSSWGRATMILMAVLIVGAIAFNVVDNIEHYNSTQIVNQGLQDGLGYSLLAVGLVLTVSGLGLIRRAPWLGAVLAIGGVWTLAVMVFWLIVPLFIAAGVSVFAIGWAKRRTNDSSLPLRDNLRGKYG